MSESTKVSLHWWHFPPYTVASGDKTTSWNKQMSGVFSSVLQSVFSSCDASGGITSTQWKHSRQFEELSWGNNSDSVDLLFPMTTNPDGVSYLDIPKPTGPGMSAEFVSLLNCPGSVHFYKGSDTPVGNDLLTVILQGWPMLVLILLGAGYSGIIIWLLDRLWNPSNFPKPFIRGFWEGFWWAFVTMTTVGYGDTTPRSFQARIYGLVWIVVGITILSVFTATVTTVLTQESLGQHLSIHGNDVGLVNGTEDYRLVIQYGGNPVILESFEEIIAEAKADNIHSAVYDQFSFAAQQADLSKGFLVERIVQNPTLHGVLVVSPEGALRNCIMRELKQERAHAFRELVKTVTPLTTKTTGALESAQSLFQPKTITYMWYGLAIWVSIFVGFVIWEYFYWRPKHKKRKAMKRQLKLERGFEAIIPDNNSTNSDSENTSCFPKRPSTFSKKQIAAMKKLANENDQYKKTNTLQHLEVPVTTSANHSPKSLLGRLSPRRSPAANNRKRELIEVGNLESLIRRQKDEIENLEDELTGYKVQWESRLKDLKRQHREERRKLLRLMDHNDSIRNVTWDTASDDSNRKDNHTQEPATLTVSKKTKFSNYDNNMLSTGGAMPYDASGISQI